MKKLLTILAAAVMFTGCSLVDSIGVKADVNYKGMTYKCSDLKQGIFKDQFGSSYRLGYNVAGNMIEFYMTEVK